MKPVSARALMWSSAILILVAFALGNPSGAFFVLVLAALCAALALVFGVTWVRILAAVLLLVALVYGAIFFKAFRADQDAYRRHAQERADPAQAAPPTPSR